MIFSVALVVLEFCLMIGYFSFCILTWAYGTYKKKFNMRIRAIVSIVNAMLWSILGVCFIILSLDYRRCFAFQIGWIVIAVFDFKKIIKK